MRFADFDHVTFSDEEEALDYLETHFHDLRTAYSEASNMNQIYVMDAEIDTDDALVPLQAKPKTVKKTTPNYEQLRPYFLQVSAEKVRKTFENTTQFATAINTGRNLQQTIKSPNPAHNVFRRNEPVASDTIFAEEPAIGGSETMAQLFIGRKSFVSDVCGMRSENEFVNTLLDNIT